MLIILIIWPERPVARARLDSIATEAFQGGFCDHLNMLLDHLADLFRPAIEPDCLLLLVDLEAELRADENLVANGLQRLPNQLFVDVRTVTLRGVKKVDATIDRRADHGDRLLFVGGRAEAEAQAHAAQADGRDFEISFSKFACSHFDVLSLT